MLYHWLSSIKLSKIKWGSLKANSSIQVMRKAESQNMENWNNYYLLPFASAVLHDIIENHYNTKHYALANVQSIDWMKRCHLLTKYFKQHSLMHAIHITRDISRGWEEQVQWVLTDAILSFIGLVDNKTFIYCLKWRRWHGIFACNHTSNNSIPKRSFTTDQISNDHTALVTFCNASEI